MAQDVYAVYHRVMRLVEIIELNIIRNIIVQFSPVKSEFRSEYTTT